jgi:hypothetical protein
LVPPDPLPLHTERGTEREVWWYGRTVLPDPTSLATREQSEKVVVLGGLVPQTSYKQREHRARRW